jgi:subtilisin family serine protease
MLSRTVVGFRIEKFDLDKNTDADASRILGAYPGFIQIARRLGFLNAVIVEVDPNQIIQFVMKTRQFVDFIEFCDIDYPLKTGGFIETLPNQYLLDKSYVSAEEIRSLHNLRTMDDSGLGVKVALLDSGISPHPYLPTLTFVQCIEHADTTHPTIKNTPINELKKLLALEDRTTNAEIFSVEASKILNGFVDKIWANWESEFIGWSQYRIREKPLVPIYRAPCGALRRISLDSINIFDRTCDVVDTYGHGTMMSGIICADSSWHNSRKIDVLGISPFVELIVVKCFDDNNPESTLVALLEALNYCKQIDVDVVCVGLWLSDNALQQKEAIDISFKKMKSVEKLIKNLRDKEVPVICPAGNDGEEGLKWPAASEYSISISSVDSKGYTSSFTNYADPSEDLVYSAFGGEKDAGLITQSLMTTDIRYGFSSFLGTSLSAAIAAGVFCNQLSKEHIRITNKQYDDMTLKTVYSRKGAFPAVSKHSSVIDRLSVNDRKVVKLEDLFDDLEVNMQKSFNPPNKMYGKGVIRA